MARRLAAAAAAVVTAGAARHVAAHARTSTFSDVVVEGRAVDWTVRVRVRDLGGAGVGVGLPDGARMDQALARAPAVAAYVAAGLHADDGGAPCFVRAPRAADVEADARAAEPTLAVRLAFACARPAPAVTLRYDLFFALDAYHSGYATVSVRGRAPMAFVFRARERTLAVAVPRDAWQSAAQYLRLGVEHIFTGYDHLAFLAALLLATGLRRRSRAGTGAVPAERGEALRQVLRIVTAFTAAHSLTLIASTLRPGLFPTRWVEPAIALSIAYVGFENVLPRAPRHRTAIVFAFGLVHGLGFSSVLREIGLPAQGLILSLLSFNVGVELGQLAVVAVVLPPVLLLARRRPFAFERWGLRAGSTVLALAGAAWFLMRVRS